MVEFALVLPLLVLLLVMAIDFGRVFFGWIALQNAARIGADQAARTPDAWPADNSADQDHQDLYQTLIAADLDAINCSYATPLPDPNFTDLDGNGTRDHGDLASVTLDCSFGLITPLAESVLGGPVALSAEATFPINGMVTLGLPEGEAEPPEPDLCPSGESEVPDLSGMTVEAARSAWEYEFSGGFDPNGQNTKIVTNQTTNPASAPGDCIPDSASVQVDHT